MALKYYLYRKDPSCILDEDVNEITQPKDPDTGTNDDPNFVVIRQDLDASVPLTSWKLNAAGNALEDVFAGKSDEERETLERETYSVPIGFQQLKEGHRVAIKARAKDALEEISWKKERAEETDLLNGNNVAMTAYANEKKAIRDANNAKEAALDAITTNDWEAIKAFNPDDFEGSNNRPE